MIKMGGSGGGPFNSGGRGGPSSSGLNVEKLENIAKKELTKDIPAPRRRVFISFRHTDKDKVDLLRGQAKNEKSNLDFIDMSLKVPFDSENAQYIKRGIRERIKRSSVTVVFVSKETHKSKWVNWEINESLKLNKGVVVVNTGKPSTKMPTSVKENRDKIQVVSWNHQEIMKAISETAEER